MAMPVYQTLIEELDAHTPCILEINNPQQVKSLLRMRYLIRTLLTLASKIFTQEQQEKLIEALRFSAKCHAGVYRKDGFTPYFMHLLEVVHILFEMKVYDFKLIISAILHDIVEDTEVTLKEIGKRFGAAIKNIVDLMTKHPNFIRKWRYWSLMKSEVDLNCRWRVIVLKFADRIHNLMTLGVLPLEKRTAKLHETKMEFPSLYRVLASTLVKLNKKGTIRNKSYSTLPFRLNNRLIYEMGRYS
jgi:(p)ppGpp synthase/HD superfamily hydrolase